MSFKTRIVDGREESAEDTFSRVEGPVWPSVAKAVMAYKSAKDAELEALIAGFWKPGGREWLAKKGKLVK